MQTNDAPDREFEKAVEAHAHTAFEEADDAMLEYAAPVLQTVTTEGQAVTVELDNRVVGNAANVPLAQDVQTALDVFVAVAE